MENIPTSISCTELFIQRISSLPTEQSQKGVKRSQEQILERKLIMDPESARRKSREIDMKHEELKSRLIFLNYHLLWETECSRMWTISNQCLVEVRLSFLEHQQDSIIQWKLEEFLLQFVTKNDGWRRCTSLSKECTKPRKTRIRDHMLRLMHINKLVQSLILELQKFLMSAVLKCKFHH